MSVVWVSQAGCRGGGGGCFCLGQGMCLVCHRQAIEICWGWGWWGGGGGGVCE